MKVLLILVLFLVVILPVQAQQVFTAHFNPLPNLSGTTGYVTEPGTDFGFNGTVINSSNSSSDAQVNVFIGTFSVCQFNRVIPANSGLPFECGVSGSNLLQSIGTGIFMTGLTANSTTIFGYNLTISLINSQMNGGSGRVMWRT